MTSPGHSLDPEALRQRMVAQLEIWASRHFVRQYSDDFAFIRGHEIRVGARIWFDPDSSLAQEMLRPDIHNFAHALARAHELRITSLELRDPDGSAEHDYSNRGGILQITLYRPRTSP